MRVDMHIHTVYSGDSNCRPPGIIRAARRRGLDGIAVTDHNTTKAWKEVAMEGKKAGVAVILGEEVEVEKDGRVVGEVLGYFLNEGIEGGDVHEILDRVAEQGGIAALPHPFCFWRGMRLDVNYIVRKLQAIEVFNSGVYLNSQNRRALELARKHGLAEIGGSDAHVEREIGNAYTIAAADGIDNFRKAIEKRKTSAEGRLSSHILRVILKILG